MDTDACVGTPVVGGKLGSFWRSQLCYIYEQVYRTLLLMERGVQVAYSRHPLNNTFGLCPCKAVLGVVPSVDGRR